MTLLSGWCTGPDGARPPHHNCTSTTCSCPCHPNNNEERDT